MKPIIPIEVLKKREEEIPDVVIEAINNLLVEEYRIGSTSIVLKQDDIVDILVESYGLDKNEIFDKGWLDFEPLFIDAGWEVEFDKPSWRETHPSTFKFTRGKVPNEQS